MTKRQRWGRLLMAMGLLFGMWAGLQAAPKGVERKQLFDGGWKFFLGDAAGAKAPGVDDSPWRTLDLPHDWSVEGGFSLAHPMGNDGGYLPAGIGWYRKTFTLPAEAQGKRVGLYFEGVYMNSEVFVNGQSAGSWPYGYSSFFYDVTSLLRFDGKPNVVAVRVDNAQQKNCRWYTGSGIYRHVWLVTTEPVHIGHWGVAVTTPQVSEERATVQVKTLLKNETEAPRRVKLAVRLIRSGSETGRTEAEVELPARGETEVVRSVEVLRPALWSPDSPALYEAHLSVTDGGRETDAVQETFGIRSVAYSATTGFLLNGRQMVLSGGCLHHDNGALGAAAYDRAEERKVELLKAAGFNAVRTSHNVPSEAFLRACDRLGLLVIDEAFDGWRESKTKHDYATLFDRWWQRDVEAMVLRDRNHPSIFCWSIGNEVIEREKIEIVTTAKRLADRVRAIDPTRPVTSALTTWNREWEIFDPLAAVHDIVGYNYQLHRAESDHRRVPGRIIMQTESYPREAFKNWAQVNDHSYVIGDFVWTAMDYLGESGIGRFYYEGESAGEHYDRNQYPWHGAYCGDIDLTGWRKPISHYRELLYNPSKKLYMAVKEPNGYYGKVKETLWSVWPTWESWNWPGHEGKNIEVEIYSRCPSVRLYVNGRLAGEKATTRAQEFKAIFAVPYEAGSVRAVGVTDGVEDPATACELHTAGQPARLRLTPDRTRLTADGQDLAFVTVEVLDKDGRVCPNADNRLTFAVSGAARLAATCSANLKDSVTYVSAERAAWKGRAMGVLRTTGKRGGITLKVTSPGLPAATVKLTGAAR